MRRLLLATRNPGKLREFQALLPEYRVVGLADFPDLPTWEERGDTFEENATEKARLVGRHTGQPALADDSGLEVDALGGEPGVHSARFAGADADDAANVYRLLERLRGRADRRARFRCVLVLVLPDGRAFNAQGLLEGRIGREPRGGSGFGYDPIFVPQGYRRTLAQLGPDIKNRLSHRARAVEALRPVLLRVLAP
ncbi:MAG: RdgB/HAM1 family non-canonical purine NTP pyrophosphatase [Thermaerobacter sp.]|nr:RdgB/HAM1 family non-canonical purine NTP pyrophosphatase [Thermaerobacter sp.]